MKSHFKYHAVHIIPTILYVCMYVRMYIRGYIIMYHNYNDIISRNLFAYSSSDRLIYLRQFATKGTDMKLVATMSGHVSEVVQV